MTKKNSKFSAIGILVTMLALGSSTYCTDQQDPPMRVRSNKTKKSKKPKKPNHTDKPNPRSRRPRPELPYDGDFRQDRCEDLITWVKCPHCSKNNEWFDRVCKECGKDMELEFNECDCYCFAECPSCPERLRIANQEPVKDEPEEGRTLGEIVRTEFPSVSQDTLKRRGKDIAIKFRTDYGNGSKDLNGKQKEVEIISHYLWKKDPEKGWVNEPVKCKVNAYVYSKAEANVILALPYW